MAEEADGWSTGALLEVGGQKVRLPLRARVAFDNGAVRLPDGRRGRLVEGSSHGWESIRRRPAARRRSDGRWSTSRARRTNGVG